MPTSRPYRAIKYALRKFFVGLPKFPVSGLGPAPVGPFGLVSPGGHFGFKFSSGFVAGREGISSMGGEATRSQKEDVAGVDIILYDIKV